MVVFLQVFLGGGMLSGHRFHPFSSSFNASAFHILTLLFSSLCACSFSPFVTASAWAHAHRFGTAGAGGESASLTAAKNSSLNGLGGANGEDSDAFYIKAAASNVDGWDAKELRGMKRPMRWDEGK